MAVDLGPRSYPTRSGRIVQNVLPNIILIDSDIKAANLLAFSQRLNSRSTMQEKVTYDVDQFLPTTDTLSAAVSSTTQTTIPVSNPSYFRPNTLWQNQRTDEILMVVDTNLGTSNITVLRAVTALNSSGGTAAANMNSGDTLIRLNTAVSEDNRRQVTHTTTPTEVYNYCQQMRWDLKLTRRQLKRAFENEDEMPRELTKMMKEVRMDADRGYLFNERARYTDDNSDDVTIMGGVRPIITTNTLAVGGTLFKSTFDDFLAESGQKYGSARKIFFVSRQIIVAFTNMLDSIASYEINTSGDRNVWIGSKVLHYMGPTGDDIMIVEDRNITDLRPGEGYGIDMTQLERRHFSNNGFSGQMEMIRNTQDNDDTGEATTIIQDDCLTWGDEKAHFKITGVEGGSYSVSTV